MVNLAKMSGGLETTARIAVARFRPPSVSRRGGTEEERENSLIVYFRAERRGRIESNQALGFRSQKTARVRHAPLAAQFLAKLIITAFPVRAATRRRKVLTEFFQSVALDPLRAAKEPPIHRPMVTG